MVNKSSVIPQKVIMKKLLQIIAILLIIYPMKLISQQGKVLRVPAVYTTIQIAIDAASHGDTVLVDSGTYFEELNFKGKLIVVMSKIGPESTILDGNFNQGFRGVSFASKENSNAVFSGFTVKSFRQYGIYCQNSSPVIKNNIIYNNTDAGIYSFEASPSIVENIISERPTLGGQRVGILSLKSTAGVAKNVIENHSDHGIYALIGGSIGISNNTIVNNDYSGVSVNGAGALIVNNIISGSSVGVSTQGTNSNPAISYNDFWDNSTTTCSNCTIGQGNIFDEPQFVDVSQKDFNLKPTSPCIDRGDPNSPLDPDGTRADMGAFYFHQSVDTGTTVSGSVNGIWTKSNSPYYVIGDIVVPTGMKLTIEPGVQVRFRGHFSFTVNGLLTAVGTELDSILFTRDEPIEAHRWAGMKFIESASGCQLVYCRFEYGNATDFSNEHPPTQDDTDNGGAIYCRDVDSIQIKHSLFFMNSSERNGAGISLHQNVSDVTISNCRFIQNTAGSVGGAIQIRNSQRINFIQNWLEQNTAQYGGGLIIDDCADIVVHNNLIYNNSAWNTLLPGGGGLVCGGASGNITISNNTIVFNTAHEASGIHVTDRSKPTIMNNIFSSNNSSSGNQIVFEGNNLPNITYTCIEGESWIGEGNIDVSPQFVDPEAGDFSLKVSSPCIDAGDPNFPKDPDGTRADMGAFYFDQGNYDTTSPAAPQILKALSADRQVILTWRKSPEQDVLRYRIYGGTTPNPITAIDSTNSANDTTKTITVLANGTTYYFRITAVDSSLNESEFSNEVSATPVAIDLPPAAPQLLQATAGIGWAKLTWLANSEPDFLRYRIYGGTTPNPIAAIDSTNSANDTTKTIPGLSNGTTYYFRVTAVDSSLNESDFSNEVSAKPSAIDLPPAAPQLLQATAGIGWAKLTWQANAEADFLRYRIYGATAPDPTTQVDSVDGASNTTKTIAGLQTGATYYFRITAVDLAMQESDFSNAVQATILSDNQPPVLQTAVYSQVAQANADIPVAIEIADSSGLRSVILHFKISVAPAFESKNMASQAGHTFTGTIPAAAITQKGAEFYISAEDSQGNRSQTPVYPIQVHFPNGISKSTPQPQGNTASAYRIFSIPLDLDDKSPAAFIKANPALDPESSGQSQWRWYGFDRANKVLRAYPDFVNISLTPDMGFPLLVNIENVQLKSGSGKTVITTVPYRMTLPQGWSLIGNPFNYNIPFDSLAVSSGTFELWGFDGDWQPNTRGLEPWSGYAIWLSEDATFTIKAGREGLNPKNSLFASQEFGEQNWLMQITVSTNESRSQFNFIGQHDEAFDEYDKFDLHAPIRIANQLGVFFKGSHAKSGPDYLKADIRSATPDGHTWEFVCLLDVGDPGRNGSERLDLQFDGVTSIPDNYEIRLIDNRSQLSYDLRANSALQFATQKRQTMQFTLIVGTTEYFQDQFEDQEGTERTHYSLQNYPNPFNPATQVVYSLSRPEDVLLRIFNLKGQLVENLVNGFQEAGLHTSVWDASKTAAGVYFIELRAGDLVVRKKCLLVK